MYGIWCSQSIRSVRNLPGHLLKGIFAIFLAKKTKLVVFPALNVEMEILIIWYFCRKVSCCLITDNKVWIFVKIDLVFYSFHNNATSYRQKGDEYAFILQKFKIIHLLNLKPFLTRLTWLIHTSVLPSNWNLGNFFALTV